MLKTNKITVILLLVLCICTVTLQANTSLNSKIGVFGNFTIMPMSITNQFSLNGAAAVSVSVCNDWIFTLGSYNAITKNVRANFNYAIKNNPNFEIEEVLTPKLINNFFEFNIEKLFLLDTCFGISVSTALALNHAKYKIVASLNELLLKEQLPDFGYDWYYVFMPTAGVYYQPNKWFRFSGVTAYRFPINANYTINNLDSDNTNIVLSNKDLGGLAFIVRFQFGGL